MGTAKKGSVLTAHLAHLAFTPPMSIQVPPEEIPSSFCLDAEGREGSTTISETGEHLPVGENARALDLLPQQMERWAALQKGMHTVTPQCTFVLEPEKSKPVKYFGVLVFLLTQGSGKDKLFKLAQNVAALTSCVSSRSAASAELMEDQLSRSRKVLRTFKIFSEINKILVNTEPDHQTRWLMHSGNLYSIVYYLLDHIIGLVELGFVKAEKSFYVSCKWYKNVFSLLRLVTSFLIDTIYYKLGLRKEQNLKASDPSHATELTAIHMHRSHLRRNFFANTVNLTLLLSSLRFPLFDKVTKTYASIGGILTALIGIYKVLKRVSDNQLTLQFC
eukprot:TRINITY_DN10531_c2_g1_i1.p1 TRINITY_DN10531_c2_g1~~TRINITY_DN10531_c2_g1_i1.p1  ORF type:complete len:351 (+),score=37.54 TRINITY_DN10531_c2_g1_i1:58-1053(+)